jgi:NAD(P)-dependent dehydrogenase (short-subunit alcohol dehydrogenase family)
LSRSGADETVRVIHGESGIAESIRVDVTNEAQASAAVDGAARKYGGIHVLFNNAGIVRHAPASDLSVEKFREVLETNLIGAFIAARAVGRHMIEKKIRGSIINMASMSGSIVNIPQKQSAYNTSKAAVIHMTRSLAVEWADYGIRVNSLSPGYIATRDLLENAPKEMIDSWLPHIPAGILGDPEDLITAVLYLASSSSKYATGSDIIVDGGYTCL